MDNRILAVAGFGIGMIWAYTEDKKYRRKQAIKQQAQGSKKTQDPQVIVIEVRA